MAITFKKLISLRSPVSSTGQDKNPYYLFFDQYRIIRSITDNSINNRIFDQSILSMKNFEYLNQILELSEKNHTQKILVGGWMDGWEDAKVCLRIAYSNHLTAIKISSLKTKYPGRAYVSFSQLKLS